MQNKLVIAALVGVINAKGLENLKHAVVKSVQKDFNEQLGQVRNFVKQGNHVVENVQDTFLDQFIEENTQVATTPAVLSAEDITKYEQITIGILEGIFDTEGLDNIDECINDGEMILKDAEEAFKNFETRDVQHVTDGIKNIADLLKYVSSAMKDCSKVAVDVKKLEAMVEVFSSPQSFAYHVGKDLLLNGVSIYHQIEDSIDAYDKKDWKRFGTDIGNAAAKTLLGSAQLGESADKYKLAQINQGILMAFGGKFDLYALLTCIGDEDKSLLMFDAAIGQFEAAIQTKNPAEAVAGVIATIAAIQQLKAGIPACKAIDTSTFNYEQLLSTYDIAAHPTEHFQMLEEDVLMNGVSIRRDVRKALKAYYKGQYAKFGYHIGSILELSVVPIEQTEEKTEEVENIFNRQMVAEVAQGFLAGTHVGQFNFTNLLVCIYGADQSALTLYQAVEDLEKAYKDHNVTEAIQGVVQTIAFMVQLKQFLPPCESINEDSMDWTYFNNIVDVVESPEKHMQVIDEDVVFNEVAITSQLSQSFDAFRSERFNDFGYKLGQIMYLATETPENLTLY